MAQSITPAFRARLMQSENLLDQMELAVELQ